MIVHPAKRLRGSFRPPGDKSISHRAIILSSLAEGPSLLRGLSEGADVGRTLSAMRALGVAIEQQEDGAWRVSGRGLRLAPPPIPLYCGNSGTTMRLLAGVLSGQPFATTLVGDASLARRPMDRIADPLRAMGAEVLGDASALTVRGQARLKGIRHASPRASAQVKSAVLLAGLNTPGITSVIEPVATRDHTERMLRGFGAWTQFQGVRIARDQIETTFALPQELKEGAPSIGEVSGHLTLKNVSFGYGDDPEEILKSVDLHVAPGEAVGITGSNGCGKSTLVYLMAGLLTPSGGRVLLDDHVPTDFDPHSVRSQICFIPQVGSLFHGTILENLTMFRGDDHAEEALFQAERLGLNDIIARLPAGYETVVGDGANDGLPGGVKQRITIARALALTPDAPVILFDEANSSLDRQSDELLKEVLSTYCGKAAMVLISHRPSILKLADRVLVLDGGTLRPQGEGNVSRPLKLKRELTA